MKKLISMVADQSFLDQCRGGAEAYCRNLGCDGFELIWGGADIPQLPQSLTYGYHLTFYPDWLDFWLEDRKALTRKYGNEQVWTRFYGGGTRQALLDLYAQDLMRAVAVGAKYVVFHVSDVSVEEGYTYRWLHTDEAVIDAAVQVLNTLFAGQPYPFALLVENQWWPGLTFTEPEKTARLLSGIAYENKGIMLDTGHLMNCNRSLRTQKDGVRYIRDMLKKHGELARAVRGMHLHYSLSGRYVESHTGAVPAELPPPEDSDRRFGFSYGHILKVDRHQPWTNPGIREVVDEIAPEFLVHELAAGDMGEKAEKVRVQMKTLSFHG